MRSILTLTLLLLIGISACKKSPSSSREQDRPVPRTLENKVSENAVKKPDNPITSGAIRLEVKWQESSPEVVSTLVTVGTLIAPGANYSGIRPETGDSLIIEGLREEDFAERETIIIEVQPPRKEPDGIPKMTLLKILN